jgi:hypothetical protein
VVAAHILGQLREGETRRRPQQDVADLVDEFWSLQNGQRTSDESEVVVEPSSDLEMEFTAIAEALAPARQEVGSSEYGRFLALHYSLLQNSRMTLPRLREDQVHS